MIRLAEEYRAVVLDNFRREYLAGRTPNPCVRCNRALKFGFLPDHARRAGILFDRFATGHYARTRPADAGGRHLLLRARDAAKDQSYFLAMLSQAQLGALVLPLGAYTKPQVRDLARAAGFADLAARAESQDFIESESYDVLFEPGEIRPGEIVDAGGRVLGRHRGIIHYTIGQRKGLGIGGAGEPYFVTGIDAAHNRIVVGRAGDLLRERMRVSGCNWIARAGPPQAPHPVQCKIRLRHPPAAARLSAAADAPGAVDVQFDTPQPSITPGQTAVFYEDDLVLGAGVIAP